MIPKPGLKYGSRNGTTEWDGFIGLLQRREADFCIMDITIMKDRAEVLQLNYLILKYALPAKLIIRYLVYQY
jgi:hypothetical protein